MVEQTLFLSGNVLEEHGDSFVLLPKTVQGAWCLEHSEESQNHQTDVRKGNYPLLHF